MGIVAALLLAACGGDGGGDVIEGTPAPPGDGALRSNRDYVFVAAAEEPLVVPFSFRASDTGDALERSTTGWLARGATWDRFLEETSSASRAGGMWRVVPDGDLRVLAGGSTEVESLRFERGDRRLRLDLNSPATGWNQGGEARFRVLDGQLTIGAETFDGSVLEILRGDRTLEDGWPASHQHDEIFLTAGESMQVVMAATADPEGISEGFAWVRTGDVERDWPQVDIRWLEVRALQDARRDVPNRWILRVPEAGIQGELTASGHDAVLGPEREARRAVEVRYTVTGWIEVDGERRDVRGMVRHSQL